MRRAWLVLALAATTQAAPAHAAGVRVEKPWARAALPGGTGAFYCTLVGGGEDDRLDGLDTDAAGMTMLHQSLTGAVMSMQAVTNIAVPANTSVRLAPGGKHAMLTDARPGLTAGTTIHLTLHFARAGDVAVDAPVVRAGGSAPP